MKNNLGENNVRIKEALARDISLATAYKTQQMAKMAEEAERVPERVPNPDGLDGYRAAGAFDSSSNRLPTPRRGSLSWVAPDLVTQGALAAGGIAIPGTLIEPNRYIDSLGEGGLLSHAETVADKARRSQRERYRDSTGKDIIREMIEDDPAAYRAYVEGGSNYGSGYHELNQKLKRLALERELLDR